MKSQMPRAARRAPKATPPMVPPTIAPVLVPSSSSLFWRSGEGLADAVEDARETPPVESVRLEVDVDVDGDGKVEVDVRLELSVDFLPERVADLKQPSME